MIFRLRARGTGNIQDRDQPPEVSAMRASPSLTECCWPDADSVAVIAIFNRVLTFKRFDFFHFPTGLHDHSLTLSGAL
jgi:hypothetical protein